MPTSPFIDDPRDAMQKQIALAVASPMEEVRVIHINAAEYQMNLARDSGLPTRGLSGSTGKRPQT